MAGRRGTDGVERKEDIERNFGVQAGARAVVLEAEPRDGHEEEEDGVPQAPTESGQAGGETPAAAPAEGERQRQGVVTPEEPADEEPEQRAGAGPDSGRRPQAARPGLGPPPRVVAHVLVGVVALPRRRPGVAGEAAQVALPRSRPLRLGAQPPARPARRCRGATRQRAAAREGRARRAGRARRPPPVEPSERPGRPRAARPPPPRRRRPRDAPPLGACASAARAGLPRRRAAPAAVRPGGPGPLLPPQRRPARPEACGPRAAPPSARRPVRRPQQRPAPAPPALTPIWSGLEPRLPLGAGHTQGPAILGRQAPSYHVQVQTVGLARPPRVVAPVGPVGAPLGAHSRGRRPRVVALAPGRAPVAQEPLRLGPRPPRRVTAPSTDGPFPAPTRTPPHGTGEGAHGRRRPF